MGVYTITQVAEKLDLKVHTIRYWEKHISLLSVKRDDQGKRLYSSHDLFVLIRLRYYIEEKKFTLQGAEEALLQEMTNANTMKQRIEVFDIMSKLESQKDRLNKARELLQADETDIVDRSAE